MKSRLITVFIASLFPSILASYYKNGRHTIQADLVRDTVTSHKHAIVDDRSRAVGQDEIDQKGYRFDCADGKGLECKECKPQGSASCRGSKSYTALFGLEEESPCYCALVWPNAPPVYVINMKDGTDHYWNRLEYVETYPRPRPHHDESTNCSALPEDYLQHICFLDNDNTTQYFDDNLEALVNSTLRLLQIERGGFKATVDRVHGSVKVFYETPEGAVAVFADKLSYELRYTDFFSLEQYNNTGLVTFDIPDEAFWRNMSLAWHITTSPSWIYGVVPIASGRVHYSVDSRDPADGLFKPCEQECGAFCFEYPECMTNRQKHIKIATLANTILASLVVFWTCVVMCLPKLKPRSGSPSAGYFCKRTLFCASAVSLMVPGEAWGTCSSTSFVQSKIVEHRDGVDFHTMSGYMSIANINGEACFDVASPTNASDPLLKASLRIRKAEFVFDLEPQYSTYATKPVTAHGHSDCPVILCSTIHCDNKCHNDRTCGGALNHVDTSYPGNAQCFNVPLTGECGDSVSPILCQRKRLFLGYTLFPDKWYVVSQLSSTPRLQLTVLATLDYLNGTVYTKAHVITASSPDHVTPILTIGGIQFFNDGISQTTFTPSKEYVMALADDASNELRPNSAHAYFVDANPLNTKAIDKVGAIQCGAEHRNNCDADPGYCRLDPGAATKLECPLDPVTTAANSVNKMPFAKDGVTYKLSHDLKTLSASVESVGSLRLLINGETALSSEVSTVIPECKLVGVANGCFQCSTGFWFKMEARSSLDSGHAVVSVASSTSSTDSVGVFNKIVSLTPDFKEIDIHGFTGLEQNDLVVTLRAGSRSCSFPLGFKAHFDDRTAIANRTDVLPPQSDGSGGNGGGIFSKLFRTIEHFFSHLFGGTVFYVVLALLALCLLGPCIVPLISLVIQTVSGLVNALTRRTKYTAVNIKYM